MVKQFYITKSCKGLCSGGFEQTLYNSEWMETQLFRLDQHLNQYKADPGYQPIYYRHGK